MEYYFENVDTLVNHLLYKKPDLSPLKLQKGLYFLFAFYTGNYQQISGQEEGFRETTYDFPKYLFKADFEAWTYGPVIPDVYRKNKDGKYHSAEFDFGVGQIDKEISNFIDDVFQMIIDKSDFALVDRSHDDQSWKNAIAQGKSTKIKMEDIANEYQQIFQSV